VLLCPSGELHSARKDGSRVLLKPAKSYQVADGVEPHCSYASVGATLFIVD
jgi:hypothetical protein